jgi:hypothetical protein
MSDPDGETTMTVPRAADANAATPARVATTVPTSTTA